jgi:hypothetical protein
MRFSSFFSSRDRKDERATKEETHRYSREELVIYRRRRARCTARKKKCHRSRDALRPSRRDVCNALGLKGTRGEP